MGKNLSYLREKILPELKYDVDYSWSGLRQILDSMPSGDDKSDVDLHLLQDVDNYIERQDALSLRAAEANSQGVKEYISSLIVKFS